MAGHLLCIPLRQVNLNPQSKDTPPMQTMRLDEQRQAAVTEWVNDFKGRQVGNDRLRHTCDALVPAAVHYCHLNPTEDLLPPLMVVIALADSEHRWCSVERLAAVLRRPPGSIIVALERGAKQGLLRVRVNPTDPGLMWVMLAGAAHVN